MTFSIIKSFLIIVFQILLKTYFYIKHRIFLSFVVCIVDVKVGNDLFYHSMDFLVVVVIVDLKPTGLILVSELLQLLELWAVPLV